MGFNQRAHQGMAHFVIGDQALAATVGERFALHASNYPIDGIVYFTQGGGFLATASCEDCRLIEQVG